MTDNETVYVSSTTARYGHTVFHVEEDCVKLSEGYREVEPAVLYSDLKVCQWCGEGTPARGDPTGDGHHESLLAAAEEQADDGDLVTDGGQDPHPDLRTYRDTKGLMGPVDLNDDRPEWADYAIGEPIAFRSGDHGVLTAPVCGYSVLEEYRGLPCVWTPGELAEEIDAELLAISEERHVPREEAPGEDDPDPELRTDGGRRTDGGLSEALYPECPECGQRDGIHKAVVGPATAAGYHDVEQFALACGHEVEPDARIESGVVDLLRLERPDTIEVRGGEP